MSVVTVRGCAVSVAPPAFNPFCAVRYLFSFHLFLHVYCVSLFSFAVLLHAYLFAVLLHAAYSARFAALHDSLTACVPV